MFFIVLIVCLAIVACVGIIAYATSYVLTNTAFLKMLKEIRDSQY